MRERAQDCRSNARRGVDDAANRAVIAFILQCSIGRSRFSWPTIRATTARLIRAYLKKTPTVLEEAEDGQQAIDKFIAGKFDLVLMDIQMPIVDGYEATTTIRSWEREHNRRRTPIVALTASALEEAVHRTKAAGCDAHVTKPVKKSTLLEAIRDAVESNQSDDERDGSRRLSRRKHAGPSNSGSGPRFERPDPGVSDAQARRHRLRFSTR